MSDQLDPFDEPGSADAARGREVHLADYWDIVSSGASSSRSALVSASWAACSRRC